MSVRSFIHGMTAGMVQTQTAAMNLNRNSIYQQNWSNMMGLHYANRVPETPTQIFTRLHREQMKNLQVVAIRELTKEDALELSDWLVEHMKSPYMIDSNPIISRLEVFCQDINDALLLKLTWS
jgi:carbamoylphosphate synthase large subunit